MLKELYKNLSRIFIGILMLTITIIIVIICTNSFHAEQRTNSAFFQKMTTLLIYQLENNQQDFDSIIKSYEEKYPVIGLLRDHDGTVLYQNQNNTKFSTSNDILLRILDEQAKAKLSSSNLNERKITDQSGLLTIEGNANDKYWGIVSRIYLGNGNLYHMNLIYQQPSLVEFLKNQILFYIVIWISALAVIIFLSRYLLKRAMEPTKRALESQKNFVSSASHELKAPLAVILANAEKIEGLTVNEPQIQSSILSIDSECMRMSNLIKDMLDLATSDAKSWTLNKSDVNIDTLLITLYEKYEPICAKKNIMLNLDLNDISFPIINTDQERVFQILSIFIDNAIHHAKDNKAIDICASVSDKSVTFYIIDHGQGIAATDSPYIFDRFYCADKSRTDKSHFGLGLSIADELAKMLRGKVDFKDTDGGGTTFFATFPYK